MAKAERQHSILLCKVLLQLSVCGLQCCMNAKPIPLHFPFRASPSFHWYQMLVFGDRGLCVSSLPRTVVVGSSSQGQAKAKSKPSAHKSQQQEKGTGILKITTTRILNGSD